MPYVSKAPKLALVGSLDGIRAITIFMVFLVHVIGEKAASFVGSVDVFFVVSGFLISTLLLQEYRANDNIAFKQFYIRRGLRLLPALYPLFLFTAVMAWFIDGGKHFTSALKEIAAAFFYMYHVFFAATLGGGAAETGDVEQINFLPHLWTLSVEEHFYLMIPVILWFAIRRNWVRQFAVLGVLFVLAGFLFRLNDIVGPLLFWLQRPDSLMVGVLAAIANAEMPTELSPRGLKILKTLGLAAAAVGTMTLLASTSITNKLDVAFEFTSIEEWDLSTSIGQKRFGLTWTQFGFTFTAISAGILVVALVRMPGWWLNRPLSVAPLQYMGRRSYGLYIWHVPLLIFWAQFLDPDDPVFNPDIVPPALLVVLALVSIVGIPILSYKYIEEPALRYKMRFTADPDSIDLSKAGGKRKAAKAKKKTNAKADTETKDPSKTT